MIIISKRGSIDADTSSTKYYKVTCHSCKTEFYFSSFDVTREKRIDGHQYLKCPVCGINIFLKPDILRNKTLVEVTEKEYKEILPDKQK